MEDKMEVTTEVTMEVKPEAEMEAPCFSPSEVFRQNEERRATGREQFKKNIREYIMNTTDMLPMFFDRYSIRAHKGGSISIEGAHAAMEEIAREWNDADSEKTAEFKCSLINKYGMDLIKFDVVNVVNVVDVPDVPDVPDVSINQL